MDTTTAATVVAFPRAVVTAQRDQSASTERPKPLIETRHLSMASKAIALQATNPRAAAVIEKLIDGQLAKAVAESTRAAAANTRYMISVDRLASGPKRTFWNSNTGIRTQDYYDVPPESWTDHDIDRVVDRLDKALQAHVAPGAPIKFQCATMGYHNWNRRENKGPRRCLYLSLCAVSGRLRAKMDIGADLDLSERVRSFLLKLPRCAASWE